MVAFSWSGAQPYSVYSGANVPFTWSGQTTENGAVAFLASCTASVTPVLLKLSSGAFSAISSIQASLTKVLIATATFYSNAAAHASAVTYSVYKYGVSRIAGQSVFTCTPKLVRVAAAGCASSAVLQCVAVLVRFASAVIAPVSSLAVSAMRVSLCRSAMYGQSALAVSVTQGISVVMSANGALRCSEKAFSTKRPILFYSASCRMQDISVRVKRFTKGDEHVCVH